MSKHINQGIREGEQPAPAEGNGSVQEVARNSPGLPQDPKGPAGVQGVTADSTRNIFIICSRGRIPKDPWPKADHCVLTSTGHLAGARGQILSCTCKYTTLWESMSTLLCSA